MLDFASGAVAAGRTTVAAAAAGRLSGLVHLDEDRRRSRTIAGRRANLELWVRDALKLEQEGRDAILGSQAPLGELLAVPSASRLEGIAASLLDAYDFVRLR